MERDPLHLRDRDQRVELALPEMVRLERQADHVGAVRQVAVFLREHQPVVAVRRAVRHLQLGLYPFVLAQQVHRLGGERDVSRAAILGRPEHRRRSRLRQLPHDANPAGVEIHLGPSQPAQLGLPRPAVERDGIEGARLRAGGLGDRQKAFASLAVQQLIRASAFFGRRRRGTESMSAMGFFARSWSLTAFRKARRRTV